MVLFELVGRSTPYVILGEHLCAKPHNLPAGDYLLEREWSNGKSKKSKKSNYVSGGRRSISGWKQSNELSYSSTGSLGSCSAPAMAAAALNGSAAIFVQ
jgi:hypothetical protein